jgi:hypothetical protein
LTAKLGSIFSGVLTSGVTLWIDNDVSFAWDKTTDKHEGSTPEIAVAKLYIALNKK